MGNGCEAKGRARHRAIVGDGVNASPSTRPVSESDAQLRARAESAERYAAELRARIAKLATALREISEYAKDGESGLTANIDIVAMRAIAALDAEEKGDG